MSMRKIFESILHEVEPSAQSSADILLFINKMKSDPEFSQMLSNLTLPTDKYKAIVQFASMLGIPDQRFDDFIRQQSIVIKNNINGETQ